MVISKVMKKNVSASKSGTLSIYSLYKALFNTFTKILLYIMDR